MGNKGRKLTLHIQGKSEERDGILGLIGPVGVGRGGRLALLRPAEEAAEVAPVDAREDQGEDEGGHQIPRLPSRPAPQPSHLAVAFANIAPFT